MRISKLAAALALGISAAALSGCATGFPAQVSRYQAMPAPQCQSFVVVPMDAREIGGLEFSRYASMVGQAMKAQGYVPAASIQGATWSPLGYGVDQGHEFRATRSACGGVGSASPAEAYTGEALRGGALGGLITRAGAITDRARPSITGGTIPSSAPVAGSTAIASIAATSTSTFAARSTMPLCSKVTPRRGRATTTSARSSPTSSKPCSRASRAARARPFASPFPRPRALRAKVGTGTAKSPPGAIRAGFFIPR